VLRERRKRREELAGLKNSDATDPAVFKKV
jgi:hypothetical protein